MPLPKGLPQVATSANVTEALSLAGLESAVVVVPLIWKVPGVGPPIRGSVYTLQTKQWAMHAALPPVARQKVACYAG